jgi:hypothetical protein
MKTIKLYDPIEQIAATIMVENKADGIFIMMDNHIINENLTFGTEFQAQPIADNEYKFIKITKMSEFTTKRFTLTKQFNASDYQVLGDEITKQGGFWQVDFGSLAVVNLLKNSNLDLDRIFKTFGFL